MNISGYWAENRRISADFSNKFMLWKGTVKIMKKEKWLVQAKKADFKRLGEKYGINPVVARIIRNRDNITDEEYDLYLNGKENSLHSPWLFKDMEKAVHILLEKIKDNKKIRVIGDYDIDGVCSSYILTDGIQNAGGCKVGMAR